ncbi:MAG: leucine-rich repeat domain-containing protein [Gammaproteobacteria bacterium]|nr:leucine-rich repeat domain-containing protein [Gammaproteobacteria bacterium]
MKISGTEIEIISHPYGRSVAPIDGEYDDSIASLLVKGKWKNDIVDFMRQKDIKGLYLNYTKGFDCENFDFLSDLPELELLKIIFLPVNTLAPIESLANLKSLSISCHWKDNIDLSSLINLERCFISFGKGAETIFECSSLRYLYIDEFKLKSFSQLENLSNLEYLTIGNSNFNNPELFYELKRLRKLVLLNCRKLDHLKGIEELENLEWLTIDGSRKLTDIKNLSLLENLKVLQLSDNKEIETLAAIKELNQLKALCFFGDTIFTDGDFSFLEKFPSLSLVGFAGRRHYTHKPVRAWNWKDYDSGKTGVVLK